MDPEDLKWVVSIFGSDEFWAVGLAGGPAAYYSALAATTVPLEMAAGVGAAFLLPVLAMAGVFAALGSGYAAARELARNENSAAGFSQGFVTGILGWNWRHTSDRLGRHYLVINQWDEAMDSIRVKYYNAGLKTGWALGAALDAPAKKAYLSKLRQVSGAHVEGAWSAGSDGEAERLRARHVQTSYVIDLASAGLRRHVITPQ